MAESNLAMRERYLTATLLNAVGILRVFLTGKDSFGVVEIAQKTGLPKNNVFRALVSFEHVGLVTQPEENGEYRLGPLARGLGMAYLKHNGGGVTRSTIPVVDDKGDVEGFMTLVLVAKENETPQLIKALERGPMRGDDIQRVFPAACGEDAGE